MLKFIRGKGHQPTAERQKIIKELFAFKRTVHHGFPSKPSALAWDPKLRLMGIGTTTGAVKVYGAPGVEFYGQHKNAESAVIKLLFIPNQGRLVSLCDDNSLHLWDINEKKDGQTTLEEVKSHALEGKLKRISALCLESSGEHLLLGTEGGNIYLLDLQTFDMAENIIYQDVVMQIVPEDYKVNPGAVEAIAEQPGHPDKILIGYNRGLVVLWNKKNPAGEKTFISNQRLESLSWHRSGSQFVSSHNDGSYVVWDVESGERPSEEPTSLYGPFPCKPVTKLVWKNSKSGEHIIFSGGMPRSSFNERQTVTVYHNKKHVVFDFTSRVVDFAVISSKDEEGEFDDPEGLVVLAEEELVVIDLVSEDWPSYTLPYLLSLHCSAITCAHSVTDVPQDLWDKIVSAGQKQSKNSSERPWLIDGGNVIETAEQQKKRDLLLTGHEDGTVRFWDSGSVVLRPLYKFSSSQLFSSDEILDSGAGNDDEEWPPFRKVGTFDPYSDDPRLAVKKIALCALSGTLAVAGTAGHVIVANIFTDEAEKEVQDTLVNIVHDRDGFVWKGHEKLPPRGGVLALAPGFQPSAILQLYPPAAATALALHAEWGLVSVGTAHGLALFDFIRHKEIITKCTLNPSDLSGAGEGPISRRKSFKKSLRESFRRLRKGRSQRPPDKKGQQTGSPGRGKSAGEASDVPTSPTSPTSPVEAKPVERQVEARSTEDSLASMVRCLYFTRCFIVNVQNTTATLWAGTNSGTVYVFTIAVPGGQKRTEEDVSCQLGKEIQLKHRAPVISISILDGSGVPLPDAFEVEKGLAKAPESSGPHRVLISSEEQFKVFTLPGLKPFCKFKLTALEGSRVRKVGYVRAVSRADPQYAETCIACLTNLGDVVILSVPDLRRQFGASVVKREDINGICSFVFTHHGEAFYLHSSSELQRLTVSAARVTEPRCRIPLPEGARPKPSEPASAAAESETEESDKKLTSPSAGPVLLNGVEEVDEEEIEKKKDEPESQVDEKEKSLAVHEKEDSTEPKVNGMEEDRLELSAADITIDSVKDHLITTANEDSKIMELKLEKIETSSKTMESVTTVVKTTTISSSETTMVNANSTVAETHENGVITPELSDALQSSSTLNEINYRKAPLATMEDIEDGSEV